MGHSPRMAVLVGCWARQAACAAGPAVGSAACVHAARAQGTLSVCAPPASRQHVRRPPSHAPPPPRPGLAPALLHQRRRAAQRARRLGVRRADEGGPGLPLRQEGSQPEPRGRAGALGRVREGAHGARPQLEHATRCRGRFTHECMAHTCMHGASCTTPALHAAGHGTVRVPPCLMRPQVHDVEDLARIGRRHGACPYYASRHLAQTADLVFCPYRCVRRPSAAGRGQACPTRLQANLHACC